MTFTAFLPFFEKKSFYKCQIHDIMSKNELRVCMFIYTLASIGALKIIRRLFLMKHIKTLTTRDLKESMKKGGCGECQTSCQSACKTSCTVGNQSCENIK